jgi:hypothetical protein
LNIIDTYNQHHITCDLYSMHETVLLEPLTQGFCDLPYTVIHSLRLRVTHQFRTEDDQEQKWQRIDAIGMIELSQSTYLAKLQCIDNSFNRFAV